MGKPNDNADDKSKELEQPTTVEIDDPVQDSGGSDEISIADLAAGGLSTEEIAMAQKHKLIPEEEKKDADGNLIPKTQKKEGEKDGEKKGDEKRQERRNDSQRVLVDGKSPERIIAELGEKTDLSPEQEAIFTAALTQNGKALYWSQKKERRARQNAEADRDAKVKERDDTIAKLQRDLEEAKKAKPRDENDDDDSDPLGLNTGKKSKPKTEDDIDPKKKPLTEEDLDRREKEKHDKEAAEVAKRNGRATEIKTALDDQQADAKERYGDEFDAAMEKTQEILKARNEGKLTELYPDPRQRARVEKDIHILFNSFAMADKFDVGSYNPADMIVDLGKQHPDFGKSKPTPKRDVNARDENDETDVDGDPEKVSRALKNVNRRGSSASLNGTGSRRTVNHDELTVEQAARMTQSQFAKLPKETRERLLGKPT